MNQYDYEEQCRQEEDEANARARDDDAAREAEGIAEMEAEKARWDALTPEQQNARIRSAPMPPLRRSFEADDLPF